MKQNKTNALRLLEKAGIPYTAAEYDTTDGSIDGISVAHKTGRSPEEVFKTLVAKGASGGIFVFCIPAGQELDVKAAARAAGEKSIHMLPLASLLGVTGYVRGGCSPIGMKKAFPTFIHSTALNLPQILVSGGRPGLQIQLTPAHLLQATGGQALPLTQG